MKMKNILNFTLLLPIIGLSSIYFYIMLTMISIQSSKFYELDPKLTPVNFIYEIIYPLPAIGILGTLLGIFILLFDFIKFKGKLTSNKFKWIYFIGVTFAIFLHYVDLGHCQIWFFD